MFTATTALLKQFIVPILFPKALLIQQQTHSTLFVYLKPTFQDQYKFIYDSLEEYCRGIDSRFPVSDLANKIKEKTVKDKKIKKNAYAFEYAVRGRNPVRSSVYDNLFAKIA